uniref:protein strawberry notch homolog 1 isoform X3 n=1 Tax=Myxine glutinosa TaxID=7769 RepID=UPI00358DE5C9
MDPGQDLLLTALSESGIFPGDGDGLEGQMAAPLEVNVPASNAQLMVMGSVDLRTLRIQPSSTTTTLLLNQMSLPSTIVVQPGSDSGGTSVPCTRTYLPSPRVNCPTTCKGSKMAQTDKAQPKEVPKASAVAGEKVSSKHDPLEKDPTWTPDDLKTRKFPSSTVVREKVEDEEDAEEEEEEMGQTETYSDYMPRKLKIGLRHPDAVVETSSLSSVEPPAVWYHLTIPEEVADRGWLSALQLEAITYTCQQHDRFLGNGDRAGFLIGDGAGVGKGRTIAGIIHENYILGRKRSLWFSVSNDLKYDAERDLRDIGAKNIGVHSLNKFKYGKITSRENGAVKKGVVFATYSSLIGESQSGGKYRTRMKQLLHWCGDDFDGVILFDECHKAKNLCPVGSSKATKTGLAVLELQNLLPRARVVYASATGASEPRNMAYMSRLGIWGPGTPFKEFSDFIQAVERRGVGAMEVVAMDMKLRGMYIARQLSFSGVAFKIEEIPLDQKYIDMYNHAVQLWVMARERFQAAASLIEAEQRMRKAMWGQFWSAHQRFFKYLCIGAKVARAVALAREELKNGKCVVIGLQSTGEARTLEALEEGGGELNDFVSTAKHTAPVTKRARLGSMSDESDEKKGTSLAKDHESGGATSDSGTESSFESQSTSGDDFNPFHDSSDGDDDPWLSRLGSRRSRLSGVGEGGGGSSATSGGRRRRGNGGSIDFQKQPDPGSLQSALLASGLGVQTNESLNRSTPPPSSFDCHSEVPVERAQALKKELLVALERLGPSLPPNTLDELIDSLGGAENVAEMTGRKGRVVTNDDGSVSYESRSELDVPVEILNLTEKKRFMDGEKNIAVISEAASSGISLQADRRAKNQRRRVHITLELPWSADRAVQQFGRTHRSNQVTAPEYLFLISTLAGERRFASVVAKRLESLGALTHGDRRATESRDLSRYNFDNKFGRQALEVVMRSIVGLETPLVLPPKCYKGEFFKDILKGLVGVGIVNIDEKSGLPSLDKDYNSMGKFLNRILGMEVSQQNSLFQYFSDTLAAVIRQAKRTGRYDMGILDLGSGTERVRRINYQKFESSSTGLIELHTVLVERGVSWDEVMDRWAELCGTEESFYISLQARNGKRTAILVQETSARRRLYSIHRPNTGIQPRPENIQDICAKYRKATAEEARPHWEDQYNASKDLCSHAYWRGRCRRACLGLPCDIGLRNRTFHVLGGSVLRSWGRVEAVMASRSGGSLKVQVVRLRTEDDQRIVGLVIPENCVPALVASFLQECQSQP